MQSRPDVVIVGGGIIGLSCAVELAIAGAQVTVLEKDKIGHGCSYGNAGWMTPCFAMPLSMPGSFLKSLKWLGNPDSPLYIKPTPSLLLANWLTRFTLAMNWKQAHAAIEALVNLSKISLSEYEKLSSEYPEIHFEKKGLLMVSETADGIAAAEDEMKLVQDYGVPGKALTKVDLKNLEPALIGNLLGGVYFPSEAHAEPLAVVQALAKKAKTLGVQIFENAEVRSFDFNNRQIKSVSSTKGVFKASKYVLATGSWSNELARQLKISVPILGGKGYSLILPKLEVQPKIPVMFVERKIAITPRKNSLRIAGTLELVNQDFSHTQRRIEAIKSGAKKILQIPADVQYQETWSGLRPCTPDGVPMIGNSKNISNLVLACGHQMLGLQSGYGSGKLVSDLIINGKSELDRSVFNPNRF